MYVLFTVICEELRLVTAVLSSLAARVEQSNVSYKLYDTYMQHVNMLWSAYSDTFIESVYLNSISSMVVRVSSLSASGLSSTNKHSINIFL